MRTLKKTLALILVVAMVLSFGIIGASADFTDVKADNEHKTAIDVLSGIGVINGMTSTTFEPDGSLTRAQAAKIIAYLVLGPTNADNISEATSQTFTDVPTSHWAAGYIEYCYNVGYINGVGNDNFAPEGKLTVAAFTKLLLCALGYDAVIEGFTGEGWAIKVATVATEANMTDDSIIVSDTRNITRAEACQLAYKLLQAKVVAYENKGTNITVNGVVINTGASNAEPVTTGATSSIEGPDNKGNNYLEFGEKYFPRLLKVSATKDGRTGYVWQFKGETIAEFSSGDEVLATSTDGTALSALTSASNSKYVGYKADSGLGYYFNDAEIPMFDTTVAYADNDYVFYGGAVYQFNQAHTAGVWNDGHADIVANPASKGIIVQFIDTDSDSMYNIVSIVKKSIAKVSGNVTTKTSGAVTTVYIPGVCPSNTTSDNISYPADLAKNDIVLYYVSLSNANYYVEKADSVSGTIVSHTTSAVTIDGSRYGVSGLNTGVTIATLQGYLNTEGNTYYLDNGGNICYVVEGDTTATTSNTFYLSDVNFASGLGGGTATAYAVKMDGTVETITVAKVNNGNNGGMVKVKAVDKDKPSDTAGTLGAKAFYTYKMNSDGTYNLTKVTVGPNASNQTTYTSSANETYSITAKNAKFLYKNANGSSTAESVLATNSTVFMYYNETTDSYRVYTGVSNALNYVANKDNVIHVLRDKNNNAQVVICTGGVTTASVSDADYVFVTSGESTYQETNGTPYYSYTAVKNGVVGETVYSYKQLEQGALYAIYAYEANGYISDVAQNVEYNVEATSVTAVTYSNGVLNITGADDAGAYLLNSDVQVFVYDNTDVYNPVVVEPSADSIPSLEFSTTTPDSIYLVQTSDNNTSIATVYIYLH